MKFSKAFYETLHEQIEYCKSHFHDTLIVVAKGLFLFLPMEVAISLVFLPSINGFPNGSLTTGFLLFTIVVLIFATFPWEFFWLKVFWRMNE